MRCRAKPIRMAKPSPKALYKGRRDQTAWMCG